MVDGGGINVSLCDPFNDFSFGSFTRLYSFLKIPFCLIFYFLSLFSFPGLLHHFSLPQTKIDRPLCSSSVGISGAGSLNNTSTEQYSFENQSFEHQHVIDSHLSYDIEDDIINMDDESNHSYVYLQQQQHYTPPPVEFQEGTATPQHQSTLIKKGSIMRNNPELMKRNRQNNS